MDGKPTQARVRDYGMRWGIEALFSDFKSRGFGITKTHLCHAERIARLILIMTIALFFAVSTAMQPDKNLPKYTPKNLSLPDIPIQKRPQANSKNNRKQHPNTKTMGIWKLCQVVRKYYGHLIGVEGMAGINFDQIAYESAPIGIVLTQHRIVKSCESNVR